MARKNSVGRISAIALAAVFAATTIGMPLAAMGAPDSPDALDGFTYVALGDSYAAGYSLEEPTGLPVAGCAQSGLNYPHKVAEELGLDLVDVSCSGAVTANIIDLEQITPAGTAPLQYLALSDETQIVTVMIGGNDLGYGEVIATCLAMSPVGPLFSDTSAANCESVFEIAPGVDGLSTKLMTEVVPALNAAFQLIAASAPNATVFVVGYPAIFPDLESIPETGCFTPLVDPETSLPTPNAFPFTNTDVEYLSGIQDDLNDALDASADAAGFTFISSLDDTGAHSACAGDEAYMNGVTVTDIDLTTSPPLIETLPGAFHPNQAGANFMASLVGPMILDTVEVPTPSPSPTPTPSPTPSPTPTASPSPIPSPTSAPAGPAGTGKETLAATGLDPAGWIGAAGLLVMAGGALLIRRRRVLS